MRCRNGTRLGPRPTVVWSSDSEDSKQGTLRERRTRLPKVRALDQAVESQKRLDGVERAGSIRQHGVYALSVQSEHRVLARPVRLRAAEQFGSGRFPDFFGEQHVLRGAMTVLGRCFAMSTPGEDIQRIAAARGILQRWTSPAREPKWVPIVGRRVAVHGQAVLGYSTLCLNTDIHIFNAKFDGFERDAMSLALRSGAPIFVDFRYEYTEAEFRVTFLTRSETRRIKQQCWSSTSTGQKRPVGQCALTEVSR